MQIYLVGGAVRDELLGREVLERDWVVVGADDKTMQGRGFRPKDTTFPVYLHPETGDEYALARTETKTAAGHRGFEVNSGPGVTLEMDLARRDLTVNAMAKAENGRIIAPHGGWDDLRQRLLRHVTPAFVEDPLRVLRLARFHAQLGPYEFRIADETEALARRMSDKGELAELSGPRIWRETRKALDSTHPRVFLDDLARWGALMQVLPEFLGANGTPVQRAMESLASPAAGPSSCNPVLRLAMLYATAWEARDADPGGLRQEVSATAQRLGLSRRNRERLFCAAVTPPPPESGREALLNWFEALDGIRQPDRVTDAIEVRRRLGDLKDDTGRVWVRALNAVRQARPAPTHRSDPEAIRKARLYALADVLSSPN